MKAAMEQHRLTTAADDVAEAVSSGYKRTEVGVIPEDWNAVRLGQLATFRTGPFGSAIHKADYIEGGIPLINPMHIVDGQLMPEAATSVSEQAANGLAVFRLRPGDIVIGRRGDMGRCAVVQESQSGWLCGTGSLIIRAFGEFEPVFIQRVLTTERAIKAIEDASVGSTMVNLNQAALAGLWIPAPPLSEQRAIAEALSDVDALLGSLDTLIAKKRAIKQAVMQQLLTGKIRLPGFSGEWEVKRLEEIGRTYGGLTGKSKADFVVGGAKYVTFMNVINNTIVDDEMFDSVCVFPSENQNRVERGDLLFNGSSETPEEVALCALMASEVSSLFLNSFCFGFRPREDAQLNGLFLSYYIRSAEGREIMKSLAQGSTRYNVSKKALLAAKVRVPTLSEQSAITTVLSDMDREITALEARRDKTHAIKQGMMQQLLTGRIRLVKAQAA